MWIFGISIWTIMFLLALVGMSVFSPKVRKIWQAIFRDIGKVTYMVPTGDGQFRLVSASKEDAQEMGVMLGQQIIEGFGRPTASSSERI
jgi:hypothetical protein